jgi:hypothetical protein
VADDSIAEDLVRALGAALVRKGVLGADDIIEAAEIAARSGDDNAADVAHALNCMIIEAAAPDQAEWEAQQRRARMHVVPE